MHQMIKYYGIVCSVIENNDTSETEVYWFLVQSFVAKFCKSQMSKNQPYECSIV